MLIYLDAANRAENYAKKASEFEHHSKRMADTAATLAKTGGVTDRKLANALISTSGKVTGGNYMFMLLCNHH